MTTGGDHVGTDLYALHSDPSTVKLLDATNTAIKDYRAGSHVLIFARTSDIFKKKFPRRALLLMQMRFDGYIGFPGGLVDKGERPEEGATRELTEEIGYDSNIFGEISQNNLLFSHADDTKKLVLHFYVKEVTEEQMKEIMRKSQNASDFGIESFGVILVPAYTMSDKYRGFPAFLQNNFVGNAKRQLIEALVQLKIFTQEEIDIALKAVPRNASSCQL